MRGCRGPAENQNGSMIGGKGRGVVLTSVGVAFAAGFLVAMFLGSPRSKPDNDSGRMITVAPENGMILVGRFPPGWPPDFPLPRHSSPKWAVATDGDLWICFTYEPVGDGPLGSRLVQFFRQQLRSAAYVLGPTMEEEVRSGSFLWRFGFFYDFEDVPPDHEGIITVPEDATVLELGGIRCGFSVEVRNYRK